MKDELKDEFFLQASKVIQGPGKNHKLPTSLNEGKA